MKAPDVLHHLEEGIWLSDPSGTLTASVTWTQSIWKADGPWKDCIVCHSIAAGRGMLRSQPDLSITAQPPRPGAPTQGGRKDPPQWGLRRLPPSASTLHFLLVPEKWSPSPWLISRRVATAISFRAYPTSHPPGPNSESLDQTMTIIHRAIPKVWLIRF